MLTEAEKRSEDRDLSLSVPVLFATGERWFVPRPFLTFKPQFEGGKCRSVLRTLSYGPVIDEIIAAIGECKDSSAVLSGVATVAAALLSINYPSLTEGELDQLLVLRAGVPPEEDWPAAVMRVAAFYPAPSTPGDSNAEAH
jgi:hypothetical protein